MKNEIEFEFNVGAPAAKPQSEPAQVKTEAVQSKIEPIPTPAPKPVIEQTAPIQEKAAPIPTPTPTPTPVQTTFIPAPEAEDDDIFGTPKESSFSTFLTKAKEVVALPALVILAIVVIIFSMALSDANSTIRELGKQIENKALQHGERISALNAEIENLKAENKKLTDANTRLTQENTRLRRQTQPRQQQQQQRNRR